MKLREMLQRLEDAEEHQEQGQDQPENRADIREAVKCLKTHYFVQNPDIGDEEVWPEADLLVQMAKEEDRKTRIEQLARSNRVFWARDILFDSVVKKDKQ